MINLTRTLAAVAAISTAIISPVEANVSFLEAALFFLTGVEATHQDTVTDTEIKLRQEPLVAHLVDGNPCAVRLRNTNNNTVWQMDFCKITGYRWVPGQLGGYYWFGKGAFCVSSNWHKPENYTDPDFTKIVTRCGLNLDIMPGLEEAYSDRLDIGTFVDKGSKPRGRRSRDRMIASYRYIQWLSKGEEPKPY